MRSNAKKRFKFLRAGGLLLISYFVLAAVVHFWVNPLPPLPSEAYPRTGDRMISHAEGMEQEILRSEGGQVYSRVVLKPGAEGPPLHWHAGFDESFRVTEGILHVEVGDEVRQLGPGEALNIPAGTRHRPFNPTPHRVVVENPGQPTFPAAFAACLGQLYGFMDERSSRQPGPRLLAQMAVFQSVCDTHAVPVVVERASAFLVAPTARLFGLKNYYPRYNERAIVRQQASH